MLWTSSNNTNQQEDGTTSPDYSFVPLKTNSNRVWIQYETKYDSHELYESTCAFQRLKNPTWPQKHVPKMRVQQPTMKQEPRHDPQQQQQENRHPNNILSGDQPLQALKYQLEVLKQTY